MVPLEDLESRDEIGELLREEDGSGVPIAAPAGRCSCFSIAFYQPFFDIDTEDLSQTAYSCSFFHRKINERVVVTRHDT